LQGSKITRVSRWRRQRASHWDGEALCQGRGRQHRQRASGPC